MNKNYIKYNLLLIIHIKKNFKNIIKDFLNYFHKKNNIKLTHNEKN